MHRKLCNFMIINIFHNVVAKLDGIVADYCKIRTGKVLQKKRSVHTDVIKRIVD